MDRKIFQFKGLNLFLAVSAIGLNLVWVVLLMLVSTLVTAADPANPPEWLPLALILAAFAGPFFIALMISAVSHDGRGPTYGIYGSIPAALLLAFIVLPANVEIGFIMVAVTVLGGVNGGMVAMRRQRE